MAVNKPLRGKYALLTLNVLTTILNIGFYLFLLAILFMLIVGLISGKISELSTVPGSPLNPASFQGFFALLYLVFVALPIVITISRLVTHNWIARFPEHEQYLLTWKKFWQKRRIFIHNTGSILLPLWTGGILVILYNSIGQILANPSKVASQASLFDDISWLFVPTPNLLQLLARWAIFLFVAITILIWSLAHLQPKEVTIMSVKELEPVYQTLDAASNYLQAIATTYTNHALEAIDEQLIQGLAEKMLKPLEQEIEQEKKDRSLLADALEQEKKDRSLLADALEQEKQNRFLLEDALEQEKKGRFLLKDALEQEKKDRSRLEKQVQELLQQDNTASIPAPPVPLASGNAGPKLNHFAENDDSSAELIG